MARQLCTPENPMPQDAPGQWEHEGAEEQECSSDYYIQWECKDCGTRWKEELPE